jgi:hypothetical protein
MRSIWIDSLQDFCDLDEKLAATPGSFDGAPGLSAPLT